MPTADRQLGYDIDQLFQGDSLGSGDLGQSPSSQNTYYDGLGAGAIVDGNLVANFQQIDGAIFSGKTTFNNTETGYRLGLDSGTAKLYIGDSTSYLNWTGSALNIAGALTASTIDIGGADASSFHVDIDGNMWLGAATFAAAPAKISNAGAGTFSSMTITGGAITGTPIASIPNSTSTDISLLDFTHDLVFSETDADTVAWATGTITMSNGRTFSITGSNTGNMTLKTYIYLDTAVSSTALQTTTTVATAMGANKKLIAVAQNGTGAATWQVNQGIGGLKITAAMSSIANNDWAYSGTWSVTDLNTVAWGAGTLTTSNGGSYSITGSNTGNMAAKTYIYFALGTSSTAFQTTTTAATAIGEGKILIAIAQNGTAEASYIVMNDKQHNIDAANIVAGSITANEIAASTITGDNILTMNISGKTATFDTGTVGGWTMGANRLSSGSGASTVGLDNTVTAGDDIRIFAGSSTMATAPFRVTEAGALTATSATITGAITATSGTIGGFTIGTSTIESTNTNLQIINAATNPIIILGEIGNGGEINIGGASAPLSNNGVFIGWDGATGYDFRAGDPAGTYMHWDDSADTLNIVGGSLNVGTTGNVRGGSTDYLTGTGFFLGYSGAAHKFSVGNPAGNYIAWNGSAFVVNGFALTTQLPSITTFSASGTWTKPTGLAYAVVKAWGGGGGGATSNDHGASGGGGGGFMERTFTAAQLGATETVTVGAGGAGGVSPSNSGAVGGNTTFGTLLTAYGGGGGTVAINDVNDYPVSGGEAGTPFAAGQTGSNNGTASSETTPIMGVYGIRVVGAIGASGLLGAAGGGATITTAYNGGNSVKGGAGGGGAHNGGTVGSGGTSIDGGNGGAGSDTTTGTAGSVRGGGGGGCSTGANNGGAGGAGYVEVWQFFS